MYEIGRVVVKTAGRDASKKAVIIDILNNRFVLIDGETRRRKCNIMHLEPLEQTVEISKNAGHDEVILAFEKLGLKARQTTPKPKQERPKQLRGKEKPKVEVVKEKKGLFGRKKKEKIVEAEVEKKAEVKETGLEELAGFDEKKEEKKEEKKPKKKAASEYDKPAKEKKPKVKKTKAGE